jgi:AcrR family transcriptional regulator
VTPAPVPAKSAIEATPTAAPEHRERLLEGLATALSEKGYAAVTIADIAQVARVSKRTFYEHFDSKPACFLALYAHASAQALGYLRHHVDVTQPWRAQIAAGLTAYLHALSARQTLLRPLFLEVYCLGAEGLAARRQVHQQFANFITQAVSTDTRLEPDQAMAIVGGIHELVLQAIELGQEGALHTLIDPAADLVRRVAEAAPHTA